ncbi:MAG: hypothetical protein RIT81_42210 [Deltaproteobacteria bacterium]
MRSVWVPATILVLGGCVDAPDVDQSQAGNSVCRNAYTATLRSDGPFCGLDSFGRSMRCAPGDRCNAIQLGGGDCCGDVACGETYTGFQLGGGAPCGLLPAGTQTNQIVDIPTFCLPGDRCTGSRAGNLAGKECTVVQTHNLAPGVPVPQIYSAYLGAGGDGCGFYFAYPTPNSIVEVATNCEPGDTCISGNLYGLCEPGPSAQVCPGMGGPPPPPPPPPPMPPVAQCQDVSLVSNVTCAGCASVDNGSFDPDSSTFTITESPMCDFALGATVVTLTITDGDGLSDSCTGVVTIVEDEPPVITPEDAEAECAAPEGTAITLNASVTDNCDPSPSLGNDAPALFPLGTTNVTWTAVDASGNTSSAGSTVTVVDTTPPTVTVGGADALWPPNHKYVRLSLADCDVTIVDTCEGELTLEEANATITCVSSDEPEEVTGNGDGHTYDDIVIVDAQTFEVRRERQGASDGRVYTVAFEVEDGNGNVTAATCQIGVPHDRSPGTVAIDSGAAYTVCR